MILAPLIAPDVHATSERKQQTEVIQLKELVDGSRVIVKNDVNFMSLFQTKIKMFE